MDPRTVTGFSPRYSFSCVLLATGLTAATYHPQTRTPGAGLNAHSFLKHVTCVWMLRYSFRRVPNIPFKARHPSCNYYLIDRVL